MLSILVDGLSALQSHFWIIISVLIVMTWSWAVMYILLVNFFGEKFTQAEYFSLSFAGFVFPLFIWAGLFFVINFLFGKIGAIIFLITLSLIPFFFLKPKKISPSTFSLILFFLISLVLRFAFLEKSTLPSYFDSAEHYRIIKAFLGFYQNGSFSFDSLFLHYYHTGYHLITSSMVYLFNINIANAMLVFGQIVLAVLPLSFFFIIKQETGSSLVAFSACVIAGFAFHMPAHLVNWGKYPALLSLLGIQFVLCLGYIFVKHNIHHKLKFSVLIGFSIVIIAFVHTRTLITFILMIISYFIVLQVKKISIRFQYLFFIVLFIVIGVEIAIVYQSSVLSPLITGYTQRDGWTLMLVLLFIPFAIRAFPDLSFFMLISLCLFMSLLFFPVSLFNYGIQTLLDRPFVQMFAYIPLSIITSIGFTGLLKIFKESKILTYTITLIVFGFFIFNTRVNHNFYPSECCQLVTPVDLSAIAWIDQTLPVNAKILIAANPLNVTSYESPQTLTGTDAGIWITPLTSKVTLLATPNLNFESTQTLFDLCSQQINYVYLGSMPQSFNQIHLASQPDWYNPIFLMPKAQVYEIIGCE